MIDHPLEADSPWKEALEAYFPQFMAFFTIVPWSVLPFSPMKTPSGDRIPMNIPSWVTADHLSFARSNC
jgi:hypothetical protein